MSWIVSLLKFTKEVQHVEELEGEADTLPLGTKSEILALLKTWFPDADYHDPSWITFNRRAELTEIIVSGADELADNGLIYGLGFRNPSYRLLRDVCTKMKWKALDPSTGDFIDFASAPPEYFWQLFPRRPSVSAGHQTLTDFIVYLRNRVLETWISGDKRALHQLAITLQTLGDSMSDSGDSTYWPIIDHLAYFAQHPELADYTLYIPEETTIRDLESRQG
jgi:hypothetical protein